MTRHWTSSGLSSQDRILTPNDVASLMTSKPRAIVSEPHRAWSGEVKARLDELAALPVGWDGYRARPVSFSVANFALQILNRVCASEAIPPQIVPGASGDLQIEWHTAAGDMEVHILAPYRVHAWRSTEATGEDGEEVELNTDFTVLAEWIADFAEQSGALNAAAA